MKKRHIISVFSFFISGLSYYFWTLVSVVKGSHWLMYEENRNAGGEHQEAIHTFLARHIEGQPYYYNMFIGDGRFIFLYMSIIFLIIAIIALFYKTTNNK